MSTDASLSAALLEYDHGTCAHCGGFVYFGPFLGYEPDLDERSVRHIWRHRNGYPACPTMYAFATPDRIGVDPGKSGPGFVIDAGGRQNGKTTRALKRLEGDPVSVMVVPDESQRRHVLRLAEKVLGPDDDDERNLRSRVVTEDRILRSQFLAGGPYRRAIVDEGQHLVCKLLSRALGVPVSYLTLYARATKSLAEMALEVEQVNRQNGWYDDSRTFGDEIALLHSEVSEALEAWRDHGFDDATEPFDCDSCTSATRSECAAGHPLPKPEGVGSEFADVLIRLLDSCARHGIDLQAEYERKTAYNRTRGYRHGGKAT